MEKELTSLNDFLLDTEALHQIETKASAFNLFEVLGVVNQEIRHSNVLAWLLDPNESHGMDDFIVRDLVNMVIQRIHDDEVDHKKCLHIALVDYTDLVVKREWKNIDILLVSEKEQLVIVIENKIWSQESNHQLNKYEQIVDNHYRDYMAVYVYLTPFGDSASHSERWVNVDYSTIIKLIEEGTSHRESNLNERSRDFLTQYIEMLRRHIVGDEELEQICKKIYAKHKKALDLIYKYKPDIQSEIATKLPNDIKGEKNLILDHSIKTFIRFTSERLDSIIEHSGSNWTPSKRIVLFEFQNRPNQLLLKCIIGPGEPALREKLHQVAIKYPELFNIAKDRLNTEYAPIYSKEILPNGYQDELDESSIVEMIEQKMNDFLKNDLEKLESAFEHEFQSDNTHQL
ncbi:PD-(D/E)XK nuclease family protein [Bacillus daqingensis]|uniref:PD-(D/E)XK nuclease family protein n=1 Tax=Bacillus daqingensis TaxID=872396 RepID=A0ABV9NS52_9BACI